MSPQDRLQAVVTELKAQLPPRLARWAHLFLACELAYGVPAALMASIVDRESLGGDALKPQGPGGRGDAGHGHGLGQIDSGSHESFLSARFEDGPMKLWTDPAFNLLYGARLLSSAFKLSKEWNVAIASYNCGLRRAMRAITALPPGANEEQRVAALDSLTTGGDYVSDVRRRCASFTDEPGV